MPPIKFGIKNTVRKKLVPFIFLVKRYAKVNAIIFTVIIDIIVNSVVNPNACPNLWLDENEFI